MDPVRRDVGAAAAPDAVTREHGARKSARSAPARGGRDDAVVKTEGHHLRFVPRLRMEDVERARHVREEIVRGAKSRVAVDAIVTGLVTGPR